MFISLVNVVLWFYFSGVTYLEVELMCFIMWGQGALGYVGHSPVLISGYRIMASARLLDSEKSIYIL
jgi:hypothetical protein